jgi:hypothetical protein
MIEIRNDHGIVWYRNHMSLMFVNTWSSSALNSRVALSQSYLGTLKSPNILHDKDVYLNFVLKSLNNFQ